MPDTGGYIFDANSGDTHQQLIRRRQLMEALLHGKRAKVSSIGEGISGAAESVMAGFGLRQAKSAEKALEAESARVTSGLPLIPGSDDYVAPGGGSGKSSENRTDRFVQTADASGKLSAVDAIEHFESGGRNIRQQVVPPGGGYNPSVGRVTGPSSAEGNFMFVKPTWQAAARAEGIDTQKYPTAMTAPYNLQRKAAQGLFNREGFRHWAPYNEKLRNHIRRQGGPQAFAEADPQKLQAYYGYAGPPADPEQASPASGMIGDGVQVADLSQTMLPPAVATMSDADQPEPVSAEARETMELEGPTQTGVSREALAAILAQQEPQQEQPVPPPPIPEGPLWTDEETQQHRGGTFVDPEEEPEPEPEFEDVGPPDQEEYRSELMNPPPGPAPEQEAYRSEPMPLPEPMPPPPPQEAYRSVVAEQQAPVVRKPQAAPPSDPAATVKPPAAQNRQMLAQAMTRPMDGQPEGNLNVAQALADRAGGGFGFSPPARLAELAPPPVAAAGVTPPAPAAAPPQAAPPAVAAKPPANTDASVSPADAPAPGSAEAQGKVAPSKLDEDIKTLEEAYRNPRLSTPDRARVKETLERFYTYREKLRTEKVATEKEERVRRETQDRDDRRFREQEKLAAERAKDAEERQTRALTASEQRAAAAQAARDKLEADRQAAAEKRQADQIEANRQRDEANRLAAEKRDAERNDPVKIAERTAAAEEAKKQKQADVDFKENYPTTREKLMTARNEVIKTFHDKGLDAALAAGPGFWEGSKAKMRQWTSPLAADEATKFMGRHTMLTGTVFLQAYETLKGGGPIANVEGIKAERAMARMDTALNARDYREALSDFKEAIERGMKAMDERAGKMGIPISDRQVEDTDRRVDHPSKAQGGDAFEDRMFLGGAPDEDKPWKNPKNWRSR